MRSERYSLSLEYKNYPGNGSECLGNTETGNNGIENKTNVEGKKRNAEKALTLEYKEYSGK